MARIHKSASVNMDTARPVIHRIGELPNSFAASTPVDCAGHIESRTARILAEAREEGERLLEKARIEAGQISEAAWDEGYRSGCHQAESQLAITESLLRQKLEQGIAALELRYDDSIRAMQNELLELSLQVAEKVICLELSRNDNAFLALADDAMSRFRQGEKVTIKVNPADYWKSMASSAQAKNGTAKNGDAVLIADEDLPERSCILESPSGIVDAGVATRLRKIREALTGNGQEGVS